MTDSKGNKGFFTERDLQLSLDIIPLQDMIEQSAKEIIDQLLKEGKIIAIGPGGGGERFRPTQKLSESVEVSK